MTQSEKTRAALSLYRIWWGGLRDFKELNSDIGVADGNEVVMTALGMLMVGDIIRDTDPRIAGRNHDLDMRQISAILRGGLYHAAHVQVVHAHAVGRPGLFTVELPVSAIGDGENADTSKWVRIPDGENA
jgi:hypothetical protein